jgi:hypothetical protein
VPPKGSVFDLTAHALPVGLVGAISLEHHLEAEAERRIPELLLPERVDLALDILPHDERFELFEPHEVLLVE